MEASRETNLLIDILKSNSLRVTSARLAVFAALVNQPPRSVHSIVQQVGASADRVSVYRTVKLFETLGILQRVTIGWKYRLELSDLFTSHHHHITCLGCAKIIPIHEHEKIEQLIDELAQKYEVHAEMHQLEIQGYCKTCRKQHIHPSIAS